MCEVFDGDLLLDEAAEISVSFWSGTRRVTSLIEIGERFFDEFEDRAHFLDSDEFAGVLAVELREVEDHHFKACPIADACLLEDFLVFFIDPQAWHAEGSF